MLFVGLCIGVGAGTERGVIRLEPHFRPTFDGLQDEQCSQGTVRTQEN
jgi:hypothetical protein